MNHIEKAKLAAMAISRYRDLGIVKRQYALSAAIGIVDHGDKDGAMSRRLLDALGLDDE